MELGVYLSGEGDATLSRGLAVAFLVAALFFIHRSFYGMRIEAPDVQDLLRCLDPR